MTKLIFKKTAPYLCYLFLSLVMSCENQSLFNELKDEKTVYISLNAYDLDSIPKEIKNLHSCTNLSISRYEELKWVIYPPSSAIDTWINSPPYMNIPNELLELEQLKSLSLVGLDIKTLPQNLYLLKNLEYLNLTLNKLDISNELGKLEKLSNLKTLIITGNKIDSNIIEKWKNDNPNINVIVGK